MDLLFLTDSVKTLAKTAGSFIRQEASIFDAKAVEYKGLNDMVSYVDKEAERILVEGLSGLLPDAGFVTEEKTVNKTSQISNWIIDPLDGTTNFIHGIPTYSVSVALEHHGELVLGVVYEVCRDECFYAYKGGGAWLNNKPVKVSTASAIAGTLLATGFPYYDFEKQEPYLNLFRDLMQQCHGLRRIGSAAVDLAYVACGRFDGYFEYNLNYYDVAAGIVLVREAGGEVMDFDGGNEPVLKREVLATNSLISSEMLACARKHFG